MRTLLIDNYDSFTFNLFQLLAEVNGEEPLVVRNDELDWDGLARLDFDNVVLSPGPGDPTRPADFGVCAAVIASCEQPLLGICLGHQGLGVAYGGEVRRAPEAVHGRRSEIVHTDAPLFAGIPNRFEAVRYHSLCLERPLPSQLEEIAVSADGVTMAVAHRRRPQWGVQFHPESVASDYGRRLLENFRDLSAAADRGCGARSVAPGGGSVRRSGVGRRECADAAAGGLRLSWRQLASAPDPERTFVALYGESADAFWLDSSGAGPRARFSFMGDADGPRAARIGYEVASGEVTTERRGREASTEIHPGGIFAWLDRELARLHAPGSQASALPFDFRCGFVGYLGYELKAECGGERAHESSRPDAAFVFADRLLAFDHELGEAFLVCLHGPGAEADAAAEWLAATERRCLDLAAAGPLPADPPELDAFPGREVSLARSRDRYLEDVAACRRHLLAGDSYELCLTNRAEVACDLDPLALYRRLRRVNPAPFSAFLRFGELAVLSSSPERFLRIDRGGEVEARPVKGTCPRGVGAGEDAALAAALRASEKNRAENLMITDLLRNDLGSVCEIGSVQVPALMEVESFATVHQLVSTVRGRLAAGTGPAGCVRACFPPGSMTGAPKRRTMDILDRLEGAPRGVYSGAIGYFGLGGGCDLGVAIRTLVLDEGLASTGAGGAIVLGSDPEEEHAEMLLKAAAPLRAIDPGFDPASISLSGPRRRSPVRAGTEFPTEQEPWP